MFLFSTLIQLLSTVCMSKHSSLKSLLLEPSLWTLFGLKRLRLPESPPPGKIWSFFHFSSFFLPCLVRNIKQGDILPRTRFYLAAPKIKKKATKQKKKKIKRAQIFSFSSCKPTWALALHLNLLCQVLPLRPPVTLHSSRVHMNFEHMDEERKEEREKGKKGTREESRTKLPEVASRMLGRPQRRRGEVGGARRVEGRRVIVFDLPPSSTCPVQGHAFKSTSVL